MSSTSPEDQEFITSSTESGKKYGYPQCCIDEFVAQTPSLMKTKRATRDDLLRFEMGHLNGTWTGFAPCLKHAQMIKDKKITLTSLIDYTKREEIVPFPNGWSFK